MPFDYVLDEVIHREALVTPERLALARGHAAEDHLGRSALRLDLDAGPISIDLPLPRTDLPELDLLSLEICTAENGIAGASLRLDLSSRTSGLPVNDYLNSGRPEDFTGAAWRDVLFPYENFLLYGIPAGMLGILTARLRIAGKGTVWLGAVNGMRRKRARGSRLTDQGLLAVLDLERPELAGVKTRFAAGRTDDALEAYLSHIKTRTEPRHIYGQAPEEASAKELEEASRICANHINGYPVGTPVNWRANPNGYLEWMHAFNRHGFFRTLLRAYRTTGDAVYARKLDECFASWIADNPEPVGHNGGGDAAWETLCVAVRVYGAWLQCFFTLLEDPNFSDATRIAILKSLHGHAEHVFQYKGWPNNWLIVESRVLALIGMLFPEFKRAGTWVDEGLRRLELEAARQIYPDGADWEFALGYHAMAVRGFLDVYEVAKLNGRALPPVFDERLPKTFEYSAGMARPDGTLPAVNDAVDCLHARDRGFLESGARLFAKPELLAGNEGLFAGRSRSFPDAGFHILASGKGDDARWALLDAGPFGASHQHEDALSLELFALGVPFLVDPGISSYLDDAWTEYYRQTRAHSTLLVNGAGQWRGRLSKDTHVASARDKNRCAFGPVFDYVRSEYRDGYRDQPADIVHTRTLIFLRGSYWIVFDEVTGNGAERIDALFHFAPMRVETDARSRRTLTRRLQGGNLEIVPLEPRQGLKLDLVCGDTDPVQGWVSVDRTDLPAPVAVYSLRGKAPLRFAAALVPFATGVNAGVEVARLPKLPPEVWGMKLSFADGSADRIFLRLTPSVRIPRTGTPLDADILVERLDPKGRRTGSAWVRGDEMTLEA